MKEERANEIVRKVFYANFNMLPPIVDEKNGKTAFHIGRMLGKMQKILEIELEKEISKECKEIESVQYDRNEIKIGDTVRTLKDKDKDGYEVFPIGTIGTVINISKNAEHPYQVSANNNWWMYSSDMLEVVDDEALHPGYRIDHCWM